MKLNDVHSLEDLPADTATLKSLLWSTICELKALNDRYELLRRSMYGSRSERHTVDASQTVIEGLLEQLPPGPAAQPKEETLVEVPAHQRRRKHRGRNSFPSDIEREQHVLDISDEEKACADCPRREECRHARLSRMPDVVREVIERIPAKYVLHQYVRHKWSCPLKKCGVAVVEPPLVTPIQKGLAGLELLLFVMVSKYQYHLPLYRIQRQIYHESRIWFTRSTMVGWIAELCVLLRPLYRAMVSDVKSGSVICSDDSRVRRITREQGAHTSYHWVYVGGGGRVAIFDYRPTRSKDAPRQFLAGVTPGSYLMIDGYTAYNDAIRKHGLVPLACMMHIRREFVEAAQVGSGKEFAERILALIRRLYALERTANEQAYTLAQRQAMRAQHSAPIMAEIKGLLSNPGIVVLPSSPIGKAINYALEHWSRAERFLTRGDLPLDNGVCERVIRDLAVGRKNWLAVGSDEGGKRMAILYSIVATCKLNNIDAQEYLRDVLMRLAMRGSGADVSDLTPLGWLKARNGGTLPALKPLYPSES